MRLLHPGMIMSGADRANQFALTETDLARRKDPWFAPDSTATTIRTLPLEPPGD